MSSGCSIHYSSDMALPEGIEKFWGWFPEDTRMQLDKQIPSIANQFISGHEANPKMDKPSPTSWDELEICIPELLQSHHSNWRVPFLLETGSRLDSELIEPSRQLVIDLKDRFIFEHESAGTSHDPTDHFRESALFDDLVAVPTPTNQQQDAVRKWLESTILPSRTSTPSALLKPMFDANFSSFLLSPTLTDPEDLPSTTSQDRESEMSYKSAAEYPADQSRRANASQDDCTSYSYPEQLIRVSCHSHDGVLHGERNCSRNCGSHCDFLRRNSKRHACECDCPCHACFQPREHTPQDSPSRSALHDHLETLELAERGAIFTVLNQPNSCASCHISLTQQAPDSDYLDAITQSELKAFFHFPPPHNKSRMQPEEFDEPFTAWSNDNEDEVDLDLDEIN